MGGGPAGFRWGGGVGGAPPPPPKMCCWGGGEEEVAELPHSPSLWGRAQALHSELRGGPKSSLRGADPHLPPPPNMAFCGAGWIWGGGDGGQRGV